MIRTRFTRWLLLTMLVGCGGATDLQNDPPSQDPYFIGDNAGNASTGLGSSSGVGNGASSSGNASNAGHGTVPNGGSFSSGGSFTAGGTSAVGGSFQSGGSAATAGAPSQGGISGVGGTDGGFTPPNLCLLPFDPGPCRGAMAMFAHVNGSCASVTYGGCEGNENRFATLEQCMAVCEGRPFPNGCPVGRVQIQSCIGCGPAGGCDTFIDICAATCTDSTDCSTGSPGCDNGVCQGIVCF